MMLVLENFVVVFGNKKGFDLTNLFKSSMESLSSNICDNQYLNLYINSLIRPFRRFKSNCFEITVYGIKEFIEKKDFLFNTLIYHLSTNNFILRFEGEEKSVESLKIEYNDKTNNTIGCFDYQLVNLLSIIEFSSRTNLSIPTILIMRIVSNLISKYKTLYKAIVIDLDETLWSGTLSEDGFNGIVNNMYSEKGVSFISFMHFVKQLTNEFGIFVALCTRNNSEEVKNAIERIDETIFPLKGQIDYIVANNNDKNSNIKEITQYLNILPNSVVFIDDNKIERDKVRKSLPEVLVIDWETHNELTTKIIGSCLFDKYELSINSRNKRRQFKVINTEREKNSLPKLLVKVSKDVEHKESKKLYAKSNQFKFVSNDINYENSESLYFEIFRENGDCIGICSVLTFIEDTEKLQILNWAISCRYFEIGLEEFILLYIKDRVNNKTVSFDFIQSSENQKVVDLINKYQTIFLHNGTNVFFDVELLKKNTNLKLI